MKNSNSNIQISMILAPGKSRYRLSVAVLSIRYLHFILAVTILNPASKTRSLYVFLGMSCDFLKKIYKKSTFFLNYHIKKKKKTNILK